MRVNFFVIEKKTQQKEQKYNDSNRKDEGEAHYFDICLMYPPAAKIEGTQMPT
jgi:hypothetical protein